MEVLPGIHQLKLPVPVVDSELSEVNAYLIKGEDGCLLVDTGWNTSYTFRALERQLQEIGVRFEDIRQILITHFHPDHYGLAGRLKELSGAKVILHQIERDYVYSRYVAMDSLLAETAELLRVHGVPEQELPRLQKASLEVRKYVVPVAPDITVRGGERLQHGRFNFEVVWTPGHSPGHVCLYEPKLRVLLSGDHLLPTIFTNVSLHPQSGENPVGKYLDSLRLIEQMEIDLVLPAHEFVFTNARRRIREMYVHHDERRLAIIGALQAGAKSAYEISSEIPWIVNGATMPFGELSSLDKRLAVMSALAHLEPLWGEGKVRKGRRDGVVVYDTLDVGSG